MSIKVMVKVWDLPLNSVEKLVLLAIADCANNEGFAYPSWDTLTAKASCSKSTLSKTLRILEGAGIIKRQPHAEIGRGKKVNTYTITLPAETISSHLELIAKIKSLRILEKRNISKSLHLELIAENKDLQKLEKNAISSTLEPRKVRPSNSVSSTLEHEPSLNRHKEPSLNNMGEKQSGKFIKPTIEQISAYCEQRNNGIDPELFFAHYQKVGWVVGKNKAMKDWKAAIITWEKSPFNSGKKKFDVNAALMESIKNG